MSTAKGPAVQLLVAREATAGTSPSTGWYTMLPNADGLSGFTPSHATVRSEPISPNMVRNKPTHVGVDVAPAFKTDLSKYVLDRLGPGLLRSVAKVPGDENTTQIYYPTAAADGGGSEDSFTVAADGDIANNVLVRTRGFRNAANNGVFKLTGTSGSTAIKVATGTLVAETVSPAGSAMVEVCGIEGASGDFRIDSDGNITSESGGLDFTTLNLVDGMDIKIGDTDSGTRFAGDTTYNGYATIDGTPTAHLITLKNRSWTVGSADTGTGKTIRIFFGVLYRTVPDGHADYLEEPAWSAELRYNGVGTANGITYEYIPGMVINDWSLMLSLRDKAKLDVNFIGRKVDGPVDAGSRISGPSSAYPPVGIELFDVTASKVISHAIYNADSGAELVAEATSATIAVNHSAKALEHIGSDGATRVNSGFIEPTVALNLYYSDMAVPLAIRNNTTVRYEYIARNNDGGISIRMPTGTLVAEARAHSLTDPVTMDTTFEAHRDPVSGYTMLITVFPYLPST